MNRYKTPSYDMSTGYPTWWPKESRVHPPKSIRGTQLTVLGCGTSVGVPALGCTCPTCRSKDPKNNRLRASVVFQVKNKVFLVDTAPDLRAQAMRAKLHWVDAVLFTHPHADHVHGLDDLRTFNFLMARSIPCYGNTWTINALYSKFDYIFKNTQVGGGKPLIDLHKVEKPFKISGINIVPLPVIHGKMPVLGYRINDIAYITDCSYIPPETLRLLKNLRILVLDCLRPAKHTTHLNIDEALDLAKKINAPKTYFTHMGHEIEYRKFAKQLPKKMYPAFDGLVLRT